MRKDFIAKRISELCSNKNVSEREVSLALGKSPAYINYLTSGKGFPIMENFFEICDYFEITPSEFFYTEIDDIIKVKEIYQEIQRICNSDLDYFLQTLKKFDSKDYLAFKDIIKKFQ